MCVPVGQPHQYKPMIRVHSATSTIVSVCVRCDEVEGGPTRQKFLENLRTKGLTYDVRCNNCGRIHSERISCEDHEAETSRVREARLQQEARLREPVNNPVSNLLVLRR